MKKIFIATIVATVYTVTALSQGLVNFATGATAANRISTNSVVGGPATGNTAATANLYYYALFASASQTTVNGTSAAISGLNSSYVFLNQGGGTPSTGWELVGIAANSASLGRFGAISQGTTSANQTAINGDGSITVQGINGGSSANLVTVGWSANIGNTLASLVAWYNNGSPLTVGWIGQSQVGVGLTLGDGSQVPTVSNMGSGTGEVPGFLLGVTPVPEPASMALAALGGASLLLFRRRK